MQTRVGMDPAKLSDVAASLPFLLTHGLATQSEIVSTLSLMAEAPWSVMDAEQSHGSLAIQHRFHRDLSAEVLCLRAYLHMCRALFSPSSEEIALARLQSRLDALRRKNPTWFGVPASGLPRCCPSRRASWTTTRTLHGGMGAMARAMGDWNGMELVERARFEHLAEVVRDQKFEALHEEQEHLLAAIGLVKQNGTRHR